MDSQVAGNRSIQEVANTVAEQLDADVIHYNGLLERHQDGLLIGECIRRRKRKNVLLILVTPGGDADVAYRVARCLQTKYERFALYVSGYCKSAGTLVAMGAHELVVSDHGELGPLDVQMSKKDELWQTQSGLTVMDTLMALQNKAFLAFEEFFLNITAGSRGSITLKTATQIATEMTTGLFAPLYSQLDPLHVGEAGRAISIASFYGNRLLTEGRNIAPEALEFITSAYPSHDFVIDRQEASRLFGEVREPTSEEAILAEKLGEQARHPNGLGKQKGPLFSFLSTEFEQTVAQDGRTEEQRRGKGDAESRDPARSGPDAVAEKAPEQPAENDEEENAPPGFVLTHEDGDKGRNSV